MPQYRTLNKGSTHSLVKPLKKVLNEVLSPCPNLTEDTVFDNATDIAVRQFQSAKGMSEDGSVGPQTWTVLLANSHDGSLQTSISVIMGREDKENAGNSGSPLPDFSGMPEQYKYVVYSGFIFRYPDALADLNDGKRVILGLRVTTNSRINKGAGTYDDRFVVLRNHKGVLTAREFQGSTEPSSYYEDGYEYSNRKKIQGKDANLDGRLDMGRLPPGAYLYRKGHSKHLGKVLEPVGLVPTERDTNHDGNFDGSDITFNLLALTDDQMKFHDGNKVETRSAGCQTMPSKTFDEFWLALGQQQEFRYVLVKFQ